MGQHLRSWVKRELEFQSQPVLYRGTVLEERKIEEEKKEGKKRKRKRRNVERRGKERKQDRRGGGRCKKAFVDQVNSQGVWTKWMHQRVRKGASGLEFDSLLVACIRTQAEEPGQDSKPLADTDALSNCRLYVSNLYF